MYVERINIRGNTRTRDYVIRREIDIGEGDAYNRAPIDRAERRLKNLDYFKNVQDQQTSRARRRIGSCSTSTLEEILRQANSPISGGYSTAERLTARNQRVRAVVLERVAQIGAVHAVSSSGVVDRIGSGQNRDDPGRADAGGLGCGLLRQ